LEEFVGLDRLPPISFILITTDLHITRTDGFCENVFPPGKEIFDFFFKFLMKERYLSWLKFLIAEVGNFLDNKIDPMAMGGYRLSF
jgi:hypothetical protein